MSQIKIAFDPSKLRLVDPTSLIVDPKNRNKHPPEQIKRFCKLLKEYGMRWPILVSERTGVIKAGEGRLLAALELKMPQVLVSYQEFDNDQQEYGFGISDNAIALWAELDLSAINTDVNLLGPDFDIDLLGMKDFVLDPSESSSSGEDCLGNMSEKFIVPPFSTLDAKQGYWKERKQKWLAFGIQSELGRSDALMGNKSREGYSGSYDLSKGESAWGGSGTSIFDPVLCELVYRWFSGKDGVIIDPFAGGSVRGIVASKIGRQYIGVELRSEQVDANRIQATEICSDPQPVWHKGDSRNILEYCKGVKADLIFSCPPYADLEVYSDRPEDLSTLEYEEFIKAYRQIIKDSVQLLKKDRFACFVVGEIRMSKKPGYYRNFVVDTIRAFEDAGAAFYNEAVLLTPIGSLPLRAGKAFNSSRKLGKNHQNVLIFCKGDAIAATEACGEIEIHLPEAEEEGELGVTASE